MRLPTLSPRARKIRRALITATLAATQTITITTNSPLAATTGALAITATALIFWTWGHDHGYRDARRQTPTQGNPCKPHPSTMKSPPTNSTAPTADTNTPSTTS